MLILTSWGCYLKWQRGLCICDKVRDHELESLFWIIWVSAKFNHKGPYKRKTRISEEKVGDMTMEAEVGVM